MINNLVFKIALELNLATTDIELELLEQTLMDLEIGLFRGLWAIGLDPVDAAIISEMIFQ